MRRALAAVLLAGIVTVLAVALGTSLPVIAAVVVLFGMPWSLVSVGIALADGPAAAIVGVGLAGLCLNVYLVTRVRR